MLMTKLASREEMLALLDWFQAMGADAALADSSCDWLARGPVSPGADYAWTRVENPAAPAEPTGNSRTTLGSRMPASAFEVRPRATTPLGPSEAETGARRIARQATSLEALESALKEFDGCGLKATATKLCFYRGAPKADLMIIGEAPGRDEDLEGRPFVGRAGRLLDKMLNAIGLGETDVHITNIVYWRPPGNRTPTPQESLACRPFLERQIELVEPKILVAAGGAAAKEIFGVTEGIMRLRGKWRNVNIGERSITAIATLHPAYLLRTPAAKQLAWQDLLQIRSKLRA
jgi:DNA polymerase